MKKFKFTTLLLLVVFAVTSIFMTACNNTPTNNNEGNKPHVHDYKKVESGSTFKMTCSCGESKNGFRIQFIYAEDGSEADSGIEVTWIDALGGKFTATTNDFGYVEALNLTEESYKISVNEDTLPVINGVEYLLNTNNFSTQTNGVGLTIPLLAVHEPTNAKDGVTGRLKDAQGDLDTSDRYAINLNKTYIATIKNSTDEVWYTVQNEGCGKYTVDATMVGDETVEINRHFANIAYVVPEPDSDVDHTQKNKLTYTVVYNDGPQDSTFCFKVPNAKSYPVSIPFTVTITYKPEDIELAKQIFVTPTHFETEPDVYKYFTKEFGTGKLIEQQTESLKPKANVSKCQDIEGSSIQDVSELDVQKMQLRDNYYYTADNKLVYARLNATSIFQNDTLANILNTSGYLTIYQVTEYDEYERCTSYKNYFGLVQAYTALTNSDGMYPLTEELKVYLEKVIKKESTTTSPHHLGELLCVYSTQINDFTNGSGTEINPYSLTLSDTTLGSYNLSIKEGEKVYLTLTGEMDITLTFNSSVKATINNSTYNEYVEVNGSKTIVFETKDGLSKDFVLTIEKYDDPYSLNIGSNAFTIVNTEIKDYEFIAPTSGKFDVVVSNSTAIVTVTVNNGTPIIIGGAETFTLNQGDSIHFKIETEFTSEFEFTIDIEENTLED